MKKDASEYILHEGDVLKHVMAPVLNQQIALIFRSWGMGEETLAQVVDAMVEADLCGIDSHGVSMLILYEKMFREGKLKMVPEPSIIRESPTTALIDGDAGLGHVIANMAMNLAVDKSLASGVGVVSVFNSSHFGAAGYFALKAAHRGVIGLVMTSTRSPLVVPTFGCEPVLGTNPIAFAAPAGRNQPFLLDMSTSTVASNKIKVYGINGWDLPEGWVTDGDGCPVTDPKILREQKAGGITPLGGTRDLGGHKGYGLAVMCQILASTLAGASFSPIRNREQKSGDPDDIGHFFMAIDPKAFRLPGLFENDLDQLIDVLHGTKPTDVNQPVLVAGEPEFQMRTKRLQEGIPIPAELMQQVRVVAQRATVPFLLNEAI